jgi:purine-nucleoside phosphorylase
MQPGGGEDKLLAAVETVQKHCGPRPFDFGLVLGSGLGDIAACVESGVSWGYREFSCFPPLAVTGHACRLTAGSFHGRRVLVFQGRYHMYQGLTAWQTTLPVRLAHALGCRRMLLTNAVGGIHPELAPGRFMFVADHLNLQGDNPLRGMAGNPFIDLSDLYATELFPRLRADVQPSGIMLEKGVLAAVVGPSYETPAEVRALKQLGADAVSMSLVPEAIMARYLGMGVVGLSFVSNRAAGLSGMRLCHEDVLTVGRSATNDLSVMIGSLCRLWFDSGSKTK